MKKSELKDGMKVETADGRKWIVVGDRLALLDGGYNLLSIYNEDLYYISQSFPDLYSITKIFVYEQYRWVEYIPDYLMEQEETLLLNFILNGRSEIQIHGNKTKVLFSTDKNPEETFTGTSTCMEGDDYNKKRGIRIATYKALQKYVQSELDKMTK